ncbi:MAG: ABC transporter substrate-binding protein, partial [Pseudomonadota bacterium]
SAEGLLSLTPDLLIGAHDTGPETVLDQLRATGLEVAIAPDGSDAESVAAKTIFVGEVLGLEAEASTLVTAYRAEMAKVAEAVAALDRAPRVLFILSIRDGAPLVGGQATSADEMIRLAGGQNAAAGIEGYKPMNREAIIAAAPDVILMTDAHADRLGGLDDVLTRPEIALTPAGRDKAGVLMPAMLLLGMGPRTAEGVRQLARALHPDQAAQIGQ